MAKPPAMRLARPQQQAKVQSSLRGQRPVLLPPVTVTLLLERQVLAAQLASELPLALLGQRLAVEQLACRLPTALFHH